MASKRKQYAITELKKIAQQVYDDLDHARGGLARVAARYTWARYAEDLNALLRLTHGGRRREAAGELAKQVAAALQDNGAVSTALYPVEIEIDNQVSQEYSVLRIDALDNVALCESLGQ